MGWCSGTEIFDTVCDNLIIDDKVNKKELLKSLIQVMWEHDWDCETDSEYIDDELVRECFIELDPDWTEKLEEMDNWDIDEEED